MNEQSSLILDVSRYFAFCEMNSVLLAFDRIFGCLETRLYLRDPLSALSDCFRSVGWSHSAQCNHKCYSAQVLIEHQIPSFFLSPSSPHLAAIIMVITVTGVLIAANIITLTHFVSRYDENSDIVT